jgi:hypothetical protein
VNKPVLIFEMLAQTQTFTSSSSMSDSLTSSAPLLEIIPCAIMLLPEEHWEAAATTAVRTNPLNAPATAQLRQALPDDMLSPSRIAILTTKYWGLDGVQLTVSFFDSPPADLRAKILSHMNAWGNFCNVRFEEVSESGKVRISLAPGNGYKSYLGMDIEHVPADQPTMYLSGFSMATPDSEFFRVVRHETGHTLGFPHEHMRPEIVDRIDPTAANAYFYDYCGWSPEVVRAQVLKPLMHSVFRADGPPDPESIMCYPLPAGIMKDHVAVKGGADIDETDAQFAGHIYPKLPLLPVP